MLSRCSPICGEIKNNLLIVVTTSLILFSEHVITVINGLTIIYKLGHGFTKQTFGKFYSLLVPTVIGHCGCKWHTDIDHILAMFGCLLNYFLI